MLYFIILKTYQELYNDCFLLAVYLKILSQYLFYVLAKCHTSKFESATDILSFALKKILSCN